MKTIKKALIYTIQLPFLLGLLVLSPVILALNCVGQRTKEDS